MNGVELEAHLQRVESKLDEILDLVRPVNAHAQWVDSLRGVLHRMKLVTDRPRLSQGSTE